MLPAILKYYMRSPINQSPGRPTLLTRQKYRPLFLVVSCASGFTTAVNARTRGRGWIGRRDGLSAAREARGARRGVLIMNINVVERRTEAARPALCRFRSASRSTCRAASASAASRPSGFRGPMTNVFCRCRTSTPPSAARAERATARTVESRAIRVEARRDDPERLALIVPGRESPVAPTHWSFGQLCEPRRRAVELSARSSGPACRRQPPAWSAVASMPS